MTITGQCLCGVVKFTSAQPPVTTRICWCTTCQKLGAGSGTVNAFFDKDGFNIEGALTDHVSVADSGNIMHRRFCTVCGTPMFSEAEVRPQVIIARAGTLDDPEIAKPQMTIWTSSAPSWAVFNPDLPRFPQGAPAH